VVVELRDLEDLRGVWGLLLQANGQVTVNWFCRFESEENRKLLYDYLELQTKAAALDSPSKSFSLQRYETFNKQVASICDDLRAWFPRSSCSATVKPGSCLVQGASSGQTCAFELDAFMALHKLLHPDLLPPSPFQFFLLVLRFLPLLGLIWIIYMIMMNEWLICAPIRIIIYSTFERTHFPG
jgi:hypothetical protein